MIGSDQELKRWRIEKRRIDARTVVDQLCNRLPLKYAQGGIEGENILVDNQAFPPFPTFPC